MKYKIYKLEWEGIVVYIGRTTLKYLCQRRVIGWKNVENIIPKKEIKMILIEETYDKTKEQYWIDYSEKKPFGKINEEDINEILTDFKKEIIILYDENGNEKGSFIKGKNLGCR